MGPLKYEISNTTNSPPMNLCKEISHKSWKKFIVECNCTELFLHIRSNFVNIVKNHFSRPQALYTLCSTQEWRLSVCCWQSCSMVNKKRNNFFIIFIYYYYRAPYLILPISPKFSSSPLDLLGYKHVTPNNIN